MDLYNRNSLKIHLVLFSFIVGLGILFLDFHTSRNVYSYDKDGTSVVVIDLYSRNDDISILYIMGLILVGGSILFSIYSYWSSSQYSRIKRDKLTQQEKRIVGLIKSSKTNKEIAIDLSISPSTVKTHINNIYKKLDINSRDELFD